MAAYGITFVDDDALMAGHEFAFVVMPEGSWIFYRESDLSPSSLEDSWAAYRALLADEPGPGGGAVDQSATEPADPLPRGKRLPAPEYEPSTYLRSVI
jgi:hypothetical protein